MSEEKSEEGIEFDIDDLLGDTSEEVVHEIDIEDIEEESSEEVEPQASGVSFQEQMRQYMEGLEDEDFSQEIKRAQEEPAQTVQEEIEQPIVEEDIIESTEVAPETISEVESRIMSASRELDSLVQGVMQQTDTNSLAATEIDIIEAKKYLSLHKLKKARNSVKKAEKALETLEEDVLYLRRSIAMLHRLMKEKKIDSIEAENILLRLRNATQCAEIGDVGVIDGIEYSLSLLNLITAISTLAILLIVFESTECRSPSGV